MHFILKLQKSLFHAFKSACGLSWHIHIVRRLFWHASHVYVTYDSVKSLLQCLTRDSAIAERSAQLKYRSTVVRITQTVHVIARGAFSATATFYSSTCIVLYTHRYTRHNYRTSSMQWRACHQQTSAQPILVMSSCQLDRNCDQPTSTTTHVVDITMYYFASTPSWTQTTVVNGHKGFKPQKWPSRSLKVHSMGHMRFPVSFQLQLCVCLSPFPRYYHLFRKI